ncbi:uncharacterized protein LOC142586092 [Dermacentor variabilis]|uniref:uncharacterized protein LOC142586092 n=1 Tax=Dermacentor variabilis TaxID=34621 RepID=UPI003F5BD8DC
METQDPATMCSPRVYFSAEETAAFLAIISEMRIGELLDSRRQRNQVHFVRVEEEMRRLGYIWTWQQLRTHGKNLKGKYNKERELQKLSGAAPSKWRWYSEMSAILSHRPMVEAQEYDVDSDAVSEAQDSQTSERSDADGWQPESEGRAQSPDDTTLSTERSSGHSPQCSSACKRGLLNYVFTCNLQRLRARRPTTPAESLSSLGAEDNHAALFIKIQEFVHAVVACQLSLIFSVPEPPPALPPMIPDFIQEQVFKPFLQPPPPRSTPMAAASDSAPYSRNEKRGSRKQARTTSPKSMNQQPHPRPDLRVVPCGRKPVPPHLGAWIHSLIPNQSPPAEAGPCKLIGEE